ncbi:MAG: M56 family metallopeptidase, partial [Acidobacteria bacterium]|nr:M56 family metallopeptidase [Acidobacteriota bacterium]
MRPDLLLQTSIDWLPLADAAVKATLLLGAAAITTRVLRHSSAAARHLVWTAALIAVLILPIVSMAIPQWRVPLVTLSRSTAIGTGQLGGGDAASASTAAGMRARLGVSAQGPAQTAGGGRAPSESRRSLAWGTLLFGLWITGALVILTRLGIGMIAVQAMSRRTLTASNAAWLPLARQLASDLGIGRITFRRSRHPSISMPMAWGVVRPVVVMPAEADGWSRDRLRIVLLHELAHVKRADCLTHMLAQAACALYWMNPLAWMAARQARAERERACDDLVLACGTPGAEYADQLLQIARDMRTGRFSSTIATASLAMANRSQLEGRLMAILDPSVPRTGLSRVRTLVGSAAALLTLVPLASLQPFTYAQAPAADALTQAGTAPPQVQAAPARPEVPTRVATAVEQRITQDVMQGVTQGVTQGAIQGVAQG